MKTAIITGTSQGLGQALMEMLIEKEFHVISLSRRFTERQRHYCEQGKCTLLKIDLADLTQTYLNEELAPLLKEKNAVPLYFFNNAFVLEPTGQVGVLKEDDIRKAVQINVTAPILLTDFFATLKGELHMANISSGAAKRPIVGWPLYCATKAANEMFFDLVAAQFAERSDVSVKNIQPGVIDTGMQQHIRNLSADEFPQVDTFRGYHESGKLASPEQVALKVLNEMGIE